jgi:outer membrane protein OmpA-like peptidoglycan-associated protein
MASDIGYSWQDTDRPSFRTDPDDRSWLRWWTSLAILLSVLLHVILVIAFDVIKIEQWTGNIDPAQRILAFKTSRVTIDKSLLEEPFIDAPTGDSQETEKTVADPTPLVDTSIDEFELQEMLADKEVKLTPQVSEASRVVAEETPQMRKATAPGPDFDNVKSVSAEAFEIELKTMRSNLLSSKRASEFQPSLELNDMASNMDEGDDFLHASAKALTKGTGDEQVVEGFSNLNDLLAQTGPLADNTKPILMPTDLLFEYDSYALREQAKLSLMRLGILIQRNPNSDFIIEGHTDSFGNDEYNRQLSIQRANAVRDWLVKSLRIETNNIRTVGFGETRPIVNPNGDVNQQTLNRRVEIEINKRAARVPNPLNATP